VEDEVARGVDGQGEADAQSHRAMSSPGHRERNQDRASEGQGDDQEAGVLPRQPARQQIVVQLN
jgi:hypothetical protein